MLLPRERTDWRGALYTTNDNPDPMNIFLVLHAASPEKKYKNNSGSQFG